MKEFYLLNKISDEEILEKSDIIFKKIREMSKLSQKNFCELYHIGLSTVRDWENNRRKPSVYLLEFMYTRVMLDFPNLEINKKKNDILSVKDFYLLNRMSDEEIKNNAREILRHLRDISNLSQRQFCELYHIQHGVLAGWESKIKKPSMYLLEFMYTRVMLDFGSDNN